MQPRRIPKDRGSELTRTPRRELDKLRQKQIQGDDARRASIMDAILEASGELGYRRVTVETVYRRYGGSRPHFYRHFGSKADCFRAAYTRESERLTQALSSFEAGRLDEKKLQKALDRLAAFVAEKPHRARALFVEVHVAGGDALGKRREVIERLSLALNQAGRETVSRHSAPPVAGEFMINVVDQAVSRALVNGEAEEFSRMVPELTMLICQTFGVEN